MHYHSTDQDVQIKAVFGECEVLKLKKLTIVQINLQQLLMRYLILNQVFNTILYNFRNERIL